MVVNEGFDREAVVEELERVRLDFHGLPDALGPVLPQLHDSRRAVPLSNPTLRVSPTPAHDRPLGQVIWEETRSPLFAPTS